MKSNSVGICPMVHDENIKNKGRGQDRDKDDKM